MKKKTYPFHSIVIKPASTNDIVLVGGCLRGIHTTPIYEVFRRNWGLQQRVVAGLSGQCWIIPLRDLKGAPMAASDVEPFVATLIHYLDTWGYANRVVVPEMGKFNERLRSFELKPVFARLEGRYDVVSNWLNT